MKTTAGKTPPIERQARVIVIWKKSEPGARPIEVHRLEATSLREALKKYHHQVLWDQGELIAHTVGNQMDTIKHGKMQVYIACETYQQPQVHLVCS